MPTVVLLGGDNQDVLFVTQDYNTADTTTMRDLILGTFTAGLSETSIQKLSAYPNPSANILNVSFNLASESEVAVELLDLKGRVIISGERQKGNKGLFEKQIDVSALPAGTYLIRVQAGEYSTIQKVNVLH